MKKIVFYLLFLTLIVNIPIYAQQNGKEGKTEVNPEIAAALRAIGSKFVNDYSWYDSVTEDDYKNKPVKIYHYTLPDGNKKRMVVYNNFYLFGNEPYSINDYTGEKEYLINKRVDFNDHFTKYNTVVQILPDYSPIFYQWENLSIPGNSDLGTALAILHRNQRHPSKETRLNFFKFDKNGKLLPGKDFILGKDSHSKIARLGLKNPVYRNSHRDIEGISKRKLYIGNYCLINFSGASKLSSIIEDPTFEIDENTAIITSTKVNNNWVSDTLDNNHRAGFFKILDPKDPFLYGVSSQKGGIVPIAQKVKVGNSEMLIPILAGDTIVEATMLDQKRLFLKYSNGGYAKLRLNSDFMPNPNNYMEKDVEDFLWEFNNLESNGNYGVVYDINMERENGFVKAKMVPNPWGSGQTIPQGLFHFKEGPYSSWEMGVKAGDLNLKDFDMDYFNNTETVIYEEQNDGTLKQVDRIVKKSYSKEYILESELNKQKRAEYQKEKEAEAKRQKIKEQKLATLEAKYGKTMVDKAFNAQVVVGMPLQLLKETDIYHIRLEADFGNEKKYKVFRPFMKDLVVWTRNGVITDIIYE